ncbi:PAS domain S-box protein [Spirosoma oryzicola]|uniref:PAS domain S-box protein n=1 Tax=Spirosoma oryzicola TaxID=2898794 RepID=UPI001E332DA4|nr:PAS domain S-box protein [Spirosoma oryzicola]UHG94100.1 PAS domain S-box protein [Spirosoma oryzicola]
MASSFQHNGALEQQSADLLATQKLLRATLDATKDMIQVFEAVRNEQGEIVDFKWILNNHASEKIYGDVLGKSLLTLNPGVVAEGIFAAFKQVVETGVPQQYEKQYVHEQFDGWFHQSVVKLNDGVTTTTSTITDRKQAQEQIKHSQAFLQSVIDSSLDIIQVFKAVRDETGNIRDFVWVMNNQKALNQNGDVIGKSLLTINPGVVQTGIFDHMIEVAQTGVPYEHEQYYAHEQFSGWFYQALVKTDDGVAMTTRDISRQKQAEQEILRLKDELTQQVTDKYQALFNSIDQGFNIIELIFDDNGRVVDYWQREHNPVFTRMTGIKDAIGKRMSELVPYVEPEWHQMIQDIYYTGEPIRVDYPVGALGQWFTAYMSRVGGEGSPLIACVYDDITERKQREQHQAFLLQLSDTLRTLDDFQTIENTSLQMLSDMLGIDRSYIATSTKGQDHTVVRAAYNPSSLTSLVGNYRMADFSEGIYWIDEQTLLIEDIATEPTLSELTRTSLKSIDLAALLSVSLREGEQPEMWSFVAANSKPRKWTKGEVELIETVAERTWAAIERAKAEEALRRSEAHLATIFQAAQVGISEIDSTGRFTRVNDKLCQLLGRSSADLLTMNVSDVTFADDIPTSEQALQQLIDTREPVSLDKRYVGADGKLVWANSSISLLPFLDKSPQTIVVITVDLTRRREAEESLRQSEERYRTLVENLPDYAIFRVGLDGLISEWLEGAQRLTGYAVDEIIGQPVSSLYTPEAQQAGDPTDELNEALQTGRAEHESLRIRKTGEYFWVNEITTAIRQETGQVVGFTKISRDISRRKRAQETLRQHEQRTRLAVEAADMATWEWQLITDEVYWNEQHFRLLGMEPQQEPVPSAVFISHIHPDDRSWVTAELLRVIAEQTLFDVEFRIVRDDGGLRWLSGYGRVTKVEADVPVQISGVMLDVTERKEAEEALKRSEERLQKALSIRTVGVIYFDLEGTIHDANDAFGRMSGYTRRDFIEGRVRWDELTPPEFMAVTRNAQQEYRLKGENTPYEKQYRRPDGSHWWGLFAGKQLGKDDYIEFVLDISESKQAQQALEETDRRKDEFLAMLAHELRNPLAPVRNGIQLLAQTHADDQVLGTLLPIMNRQMDHLLRMLDDLLDVSRISRGKIELRKERIDLTQVVNQAIDAIQTLYTDSGRQLSTQLPAYSLYVDGDATRLHQVVTNLLTNGLRYTNQGGQVWLTLEPVGEQAILRVADNGIGIAAHQLDAIFELFVQADTSLARSHGGLGLGLTLVKELTAMHGGRVEAHSEGLEQGSEFVVYLPILMAESVEK